MAQEQRQSTNVMADLLDLPVVSAGLRTAQAQGVNWGRRLRQEHGDRDPDAVVEEAIRSAMWRTAGTGALAGLNRMAAEGHAD